MWVVFDGCELKIIDVEIVENRVRIITPIRNIIIKPKKAITRQKIYEFIKARLHEKKTWIMLELLEAIMGEKCLNHQS